MRAHKLRFLLGTGMLTLTLLSGLAGCAVAPKYTDTEQELSDTMGKDSFQPATRALRDGIETQDELTQAAFWMHEYDLNPADLESAIKLSAAVRKLGNPQRAAEITQTTRALYPRDPYLAAEYAAALIASERPVDAMEPLNQALTYAPAYGRLWSLKGAALDQQEQYELARKHYARALDITPNDPSVMANMGLSYALSGDPVTAESWLRRAVALPGATKSVRQNLALVLQIQGKTEEAEKMARLAQGQASEKLPDLHPQPAQTLRGSPTVQNSVPYQPQRQVQSQTQTQTQDTTQYNRSAAYQSPYASNGFTSPPPNVTVQNSPSIQAGLKPQATEPSMTNPYAQANSASDAARLAAQQSNRRPQRETLTPQQYQEQQDILARLAGNVGAKPANPALRRPQPTPRQNQMPSPNRMPNQGEQSAPYYPGRSNSGMANTQYRAPQPYAAQQTTGQPYPPQTQPPRRALRNRR